MRNIFLYPVEAINALRTNVWAVGLIVVGTILVLHGHSDVGASLTTGGFAILRGEAAGANTNPTQPQDPTNVKPTE